MPTIDESVEIARSAKDVYDFVRTPENQTLWNSNLETYEQVTPGELAKGSRYRGVTRVAGKRIEWTSEVTELHPAERVEIRSLEAPMEFHVTQRFEPLDADRCRFTFHQEVPSLGGFFGKLGDAVVTRMYSRDVASNLEKLKALLEA